MKTQFNSGTWIVRADYGKENVYRLWDEDTNYHEDTTPETMDANARLMSASPDLFRACCEAMQDWQTLGTIDAETVKHIQIALTKAS